MVKKKDQMCISLMYKWKEVRIDRQVALKIDLSQIKLKKMLRTRASTTCQKLKDRAL